MERWKFGRGQTTAEERAEMRAAQRAGRAVEYAAGQRFALLVEAEAERRRQRKRARPAISRGGR
jgi:hypothetical protein